MSPALLLGRRAIDAMAEAVRRAPLVRLRDLRFVAPTRREKRRVR